MMSNTLSSRHDAEWLLQQELLRTDIDLRNRRKYGTKRPNVEIKVPRRLVTATPEQRAVVAQRMREAAQTLRALDGDLQMVLDMLGLADAPLTTTYTDKGERRRYVAPCADCGRPYIQLRTDGTYIAHPRESKQPINDDTRCPGTGKPAGDKAQTRERPTAPTPGRRVVRAPARPEPHGIPDNRTACQGEDRELFYPATYGPKYAEQVADAKRVCRDCPLRQACLQYALDHGELTYGIWGGTTPNERKALARRTAA